MGKVPVESDSGPQAEDAASNALSEAPQGEQSAEQIDVASALLEHLQAHADVALQFAPAEEVRADNDDLLPAALNDLAAHNIEQALDQLTASPDLFDLPPLDFGGDGGPCDS
jgi:hypothetical protein